uniref:Uncharacterized protein n=1 Tax=Anguilla anguilla TaxID=7936 RepID=A0A0E9RVW0_ANGAN
MAVTLMITDFFNYNYGILDILDLE